MNALVRRSPEDTRSAIVDAAWDLFRQLGARTTVGDVAETLGMSSANVYRFFPTKQALCEATCERVLGLVFEAVRSAAEAQPTARAAIEAALGTMHVLMRDQMTAAARTHEIVDQAIAERWTPIDAHHVRCAELIAGYIAEGQAADEFGPGDPGALAIGALSACAAIHHPTLIAQCAGKDPWPAPEAVIGFAMRALAGAG